MGVLKEEDPGRTILICENYSNYLPFNLYNIQLQERVGRRMGKRGKAL
jgi:hypothetical protein